MDINTPSIKISGATNLTAEIINLLCDFGTPENPREPSDEEKWKVIRLARNELIEQISWMLNPGVPISLTAIQAVQNYIQALRDVPQTFDNPDDVIFPEAPKYETI